MLSEYLFTATEQSTKVLIDELRKIAMEIGFTDDSIKFKEKNAFFSKNVNVTITLEGAYAYQDRFQKAIMHKFGSYKCIKNFK